LKIKNNIILEIEKSITHNSNNILKFLIYYNNLVINNELNEEYDEIINNPLNFYTKNIDHTKKNHFIYELATVIAINMVELINDLKPEAEKYFLNEEFLQFCFKITREKNNKILENNLKYNKAKKEISLDLVISKKWIRDLLENSIKEPYFHLIIKMLK